MKDDNVLKSNRMDDFTMILSWYKCHWDLSVINIDAVCFDQLFSAWVEKTTGVQ